MERKRNFAGVRCRCATRHSYSSLSTDTPSHTFDGQFSGVKFLVVHCSRRSARLVSTCSKHLKRVVCCTLHCLEYATDDVTVNGQLTNCRYVGQVNLLRPDRVPSLRFRGLSGTEIGKRRATDRYLSRRATGPPGYARARRILRSLGGRQLQTHTTRPC
jgi:hypothetical protein